MDIQEVLDIIDEVFSMVEECEIPFSEAQTIIREKILRLLEQQED